MTDDNNPFRPALAKPVDDSVLANDPVADNFLAGNDNLANQAMKPSGIAMDNVMPVTNPMVTAANPYLDQMGNIEPMPVTNPTDSMPFGDPLGGDSTGDANMPSQFNMTPNNPTTTPESDNKKAKKAKRGLLGKKKKDEQSAITEQTATTVESNLTQSDVTMPTDLATNDFASLTNSNDLSPIGASLAAAADMADNKTGDIDIDTAKKPTKNSKANKSGQPKQLTISVLTIVFAALFLAAGGGAVYFYMQNNENSTKLSDVQAELQQLKDETNSNNTSSNKTSAQFDALQNRIAELTKQNEAKQKQLDQNKATIEELNKKSTELNNQLTAANNKLTSDTKVSESVNSLITTMCTNPEFQGSSVCVTANGGQATGGAVVPQQ